MRSQSFGVTIMAGLGEKGEVRNQFFNRPLSSHLPSALIRKKLTATPTTLSRIFINFLGIKV